MDPNIVVSPSHIKLAEEFHALEVFNAFHKVWERGDIFLGDSIEWLIVNDVL